MLLQEAPEGELEREKAVTPSSDGVCVSSFVVVFLGGLIYTHPPTHPGNAQNMSPFAERATKGTATNRAKRPFFRVANLGRRLSGGENRTKKVVDVYDEIVVTLAGQGKKTRIRQVEIENQLTLQLGATQRRTLTRHIGLMERLGYLKILSGGTAYTGSMFDLVEKKLEEIKLRRKAQELATGQKGEGKRR